MKSVAELRSEVGARFEKNFAAWAQASVSEQSAWPMSVSLAAPDEKQALADFEGTAGWARSWLALGVTLEVSGAARVTSAHRAWRTGSQRIPTHAIFDTPDAVAAFVGRAKDWNRALERLSDVRGDWPSVADLDRKTFTRLLSLSAVEWQRIRAFLLWVDGNPTSGLLPRQLPIPGVDSKWFEVNRTLCASLRRATTPDDTEGFGLRSLEKLLTIRVLDPELRSRLGGLGDFSAEPAVLAALDWNPRVVIVCENLQCAYSFADIEGAVLIAKQGYAVDVLSRLPWLAGARILYWGDLDTHGFGILNRFRNYFPGAESILMDLYTLLENRSLWATEPEPNVQTLSLLTDTEQDVLARLRSGELGMAVRLEQERIPWVLVENAVARALS